MSAVATILLAHHEEVSARPSGVGPLAVEDELAAVLSTGSLDNGVAALQDRLHNSPQEVIAATLR
jgi:hypothetical protein